MTRLALRTGRPEPGLRLVGDWARRRTEEIAHTSARSIWAEVAAYEQADDGHLFAEVEAHCRQVLGVYAAGMREGRPAERSDFPWTARHAMRRVDLGIGLADFLQAFRIGQITLWEDVQRGVENGEVDADAAMQVVGHILRTIEVGSSVAAETYLESQQYQLADSARQARDLLEDLLAGNALVVAEQRKALEQVGLAAEAELAVVVAALPDVAQHHYDVRRQLRLTLDATSYGLIVSRHDELVALLPVPRTGADQLVRSVRSAITRLAGAGLVMRCGMSGLHRGYEGVPAAYQQARMALQTLTRPGLRAVPELSTLDLLVHSQPELGKLVPASVRSFVEDDLASGGVLVDTLTTYIANDLNARETALRLNHHVNTVYYRLSRIADRTGRDVRSAEDLIDLLLSVRLLRAEKRD